MATELDNHLQFHAQALNLRAARQQVLASNIANADTPGYKARDIDFNKTLQDALAGRVQPSQLARSAAGHLAPAGQGAVAGAVQYRAVVQPSLDGNTVDMDVERAQFAENAIHYEANLLFINSQLKSLLAAIQG
ncbi:MAG: flagellar basal body rod protein FlgB [Betaproteobacteria bacterium]|nr:flagellar basal body rod protein FlgB [Betaproteobacteria bacterium]